MDIDRHANVRSPVHAWDPRWKLVALSVFVACSAAVQSPPALLAVLSVALLLVFLARLPVLFALRSLRYPVLFVVLMLPVLAVTAGGAALTRIGPLPLYREGIATAAAIGVRAVAIVLAFLVMFSTARVHVTMQALQRLRVPAALVLILLFTYRYIFLYVEDLRKLRNAARLRGFSFAGGVRRLRTPASLIVVLLVRSFEQSERVEAAMRLRGFDGDFRTEARFETSRADVLKALVFSFLPVGALLVEVL